MRDITRSYRNRRASGNRVHGRGWGGVGRLATLTGVLGVSAY
jgi:hypothetical protein